MFDIVRLFFFFACKGIWGGQVSCDQQVADVMHYLQTYWTRDKSQNHSVLQFFSYRKADKSICLKVEVCTCCGISPYSPRICAHADLLKCSKGKSRLALRQSDGIQKPCISFLHKAHPSWDGLLTWIKHQMAYSAFKSWLEVHVAFE